MKLYCWLSKWTFPLFSFSDEVDHLLSLPESKTGLEIHSAALFGEISDHKFCPPDSSEDFIVNVIVMMG